MSKPLYTERLPYAERFGPKSVHSAAHQVVPYQVLPPVPEALFEPEDWILNSDDISRMRTMGKDGDPIDGYNGNPEVQAAMIAEEHAALRLRDRKPHLYAAAQATQRIAGVVRRTPLIDGSELVPGAGAKIWLKMENLQHGGSFKLRGAANAILQLTPEQLEYGVSAFSAGNHGIGVTLTAAHVQTAATIFMPKNASPIKVDYNKEHGARVIQAGETVDEARLACQAWVEEHPHTNFIHPYDNQAVMIGQSSDLIEYLQEVARLDVAVIPIGGGGYIAWLATAIKEYNPEAIVVGVQSVGADAARRSKLAGRIVTLSDVNPLSDGTAVRSPGTTAFKHILESVDHIVTVTDREIAEVVVDYHELYKGRDQSRVEAAGALAVAAMRKMTGELSGTVVGMVSGGNISDAALEHMYDLAGRSYQAA